MLDWMFGQGTWFGDIIADANQIAGAIQAVTAMAAVALGVLAFRIARRQTDLAVQADRERQREAQILAVAPLLMPEPEVQNLDQLVAIVALRVPADTTALGLTVTLRHDHIPEYAAISSPRSLGPDERTSIHLPIRRFFDANIRWFGPGEEASYRPGVEKPFEVVAQYRGLLEQTVIEHYVWDMWGATDGRNREWRLARLEIITTVPGASAVDLHFGP